MVESQPELDRCGGGKDGREFGLRRALLLEPRLIIHRVCSAARSQTALASGFLPAAQLTHWLLIPRVVHSFGSRLGAGLCGTPDTLHTCSLSSGGERGFGAGHPFATHLSVDRQIVFNYTLGTAWGGLRRPTRAAGSCRGARLPPTQGTEAYCTLDHHVVAEHRHPCQEALVGVSHACGGVAGCG